MSKYLYGASVQGIQDFIFKTNKLQEIVGASEIVKGIETVFTANYHPDEILLNAAGNIKAIFSEDECNTVVKLFPKEMMENAYGITISQAVIMIEGDTPTKEEFRDLDKQLKIQRNKPSMPLDVSLNIMELNPATAKPISKIIKKDNDIILLDKASEQKRDKFPKNEKYKELKDLSNGKNKLAVIHADGNGLGKLIPQLGDKLSAFSVALNKATKEAFKEAKTEDMKIREVILGGDDLTVICDANEALTFAQKYLENFEKNTSKIKELEGLADKLTACAGIAYINEKYPFHYAVSLAETLCGQSKKASNRESSCLMFHNIQSSNFQSWGKFVEDELTIRNDKDTIRCDFGPYYIDKEGEPLVSKLQVSVGAYACEGSPISRLRKWMIELSKSSVYSENLLKRINEMTAQSNNWNCKIMHKNLENLYEKLSNETLIVEKDGVLKTPIYDILQILSVTEAK